MWERIGWGCSAAGHRSSVPLQHAALRLSGPFRARGPAALGPPRHSMSSWPTELHPSMMHSHEQSVLPVEAQEQPQSPCLNLPALCVPDPPPSRPHPPAPAAAPSTPTSPAPATASPAPRAPMPTSSAQMPALPATMACLTSSPMRAACGPRTAARLAWSNLPWVRRAASKKRRTATFPAICLLTSSLPSSLSPSAPVGRLPGRHARLRPGRLPRFHPV